MSRSSIQSWANSSLALVQADDDASEIQRESPWLREKVVGSDAEWQKGMDFAQAVLLHGRTSERIRFLQEELLPMANNTGLGLSQTLDIFKLLTLTYPRYPDAASRHVVEEVGMQLVKQDEERESKLGVTEQIIGWISVESGRICKRGGSHACSDLFVLFSWTCALYTVALEKDEVFVSRPVYQTLVESLALLLDSIYSDPAAKSTIKRGAMTRARRALRAAPSRLPTLMQTVVKSAKASSDEKQFITLLGTSIDVYIRLKNQTIHDPPPDVKADIIHIYDSSILLSKSSVSAHIPAALHDFFHTYVTEDDFINNILPFIEKSLLRSPEYSLDAIGKFFDAYSHPINDAAYHRVLNPLLACAKSTNPAVRSGSVNAFKALNTTQPTAGSAMLEYSVTELLALPKAGKTTGPDHRVTLYAMLATLQPNPTVSPSIISFSPSLIVKETHDAAISTLSELMSQHLQFVLHSDDHRCQISPATALSITKELTNAKPTIRRAFFSLIGQALWGNNGDNQGNIVTTNVDTEAAMKLAKDIRPALGNAVKSVTANPSAVNSSAGPFEGYVSLALLLGPIGKFDETILADPIIQAIPSSATTAKPSFLLLDKIYQKLSEEDEEQWILRAVAAAVIFFKDDLLKSEASRIQLGAVFIHLANSTSPAIRKCVVNSLESLASQTPVLINRIIREALVQLLSKGSQFSKGKGDSRSPGPLRFSALLLGCAPFSEVIELETKQQLLVEFIVLAHHPSVSGSSQQTWIQLCQKAKVDPHELVNGHLPRLMELILAATEPGDKAAADFAAAAFAAVRTLAFVSPQVAVPRVMEQLRFDLDAAPVKALTEDDFGIWATPEGTTYVDVLSSSKEERTTFKGKDAELAKWEAEVRKSLASKKGAAAGTVALTKQQRALIEAQLKVESTRRKHVNILKAKFERGLHLIQSLVASQTTEFHTYISSVIWLLFDGPLVVGSRLLGLHPFETYMSLAQCSSERLDTFQKWVGVAGLRCLAASAVPEELQTEPLCQLVIRVLLRLRSLSEQAPFDAATFSYTFPLLSQVLAQGGVDVNENEDEALEQVTLALDIVKIHAGEFSNPIFPRQRAIQDLLLVIRQLPQFRKAASSALIDMGEAIHSSAEREVIDVLIDGTLSQESYARNSCLHTLQPFDLTDLDWSPQLWIVCHDEDEQNARLAKHVWEDNGLDVPEGFLGVLQSYLEYPNAPIRLSAAVAITEAVEQYPRTAQTTVSSLQDYYRDKARIVAPEFDQYGMVIAQSLDQTDPWPARLAICQTFERLAPFMSPKDVEPFIFFLIKDEALGDRVPDVRKGMLAAGAAVIDLHGAACLPELISMFESHLGQTSPATETGDHIEEAVVILFGRLARHLQPNDQRMNAIIDRLVGALKTPSEQVQVAVSECLSPLAKLMGPRLSSLADNLMNDLFTAPKYAARRGAAYGLAGIVHGAGIGAFKRFGVIQRLRTAAEDKKSFESRQGAMFAFETLSNTFGRLFEPYITFVLPLLLTCFGDATPDVREATIDASRVIMGNMSGYGLKLVLPSLLSGLEEKQWRTKKGSIELLGMMAYCSPRQLSLSLPVVIPRLTDVLTDSHAQVRAAANKSLKQFGEVISNPEIQSLVPVLLKALADPAKTSNALSSLLKKSFMHYIDRSSLALVVPILERGLRERGAEIKKKAAQIVGNLASLTDSKDFVPYLAQLLPLVHVVLVDPVPEARATAAKSLGTLVERLGEGHFPDLVPGLLRTLKTDTSGVDRQGAAQGLSEVLAGLGMERLEGLLPDIIANAQSPRSTVKEGFMSLLVYLPATFGTRFQPHLPKIIAPILGGLSDTEESVREVAMRAGRMVVTNYSTKAIDLLLPELEQGMFDPGWRIRQSSITLVGELLFKVSGITGKPDIEDEDVSPEVSESSRRALVEVLGADRRDRILSALYLVRQDAVSVVRQSSIQIWKALVNNTPRTVREILPQLMEQIIFLISGEDNEQQEAASRTMGELCRKFGERVVGEMMAILRERASSTDPRTREGACLTISELMENSTETHREEHADDIIAIVRQSLVDDEANVRSAAAKAFDILQEHLGVRAIDETIPTLLEALRQPGKGSGTALQALREVMSVRASTVFPVLIPTLTSIPMSVFNARALAALVTVAGNALSRRLTVIIGALVKVIEEERDEELLSAADEALRALLESINDAEGLNTLMMLLIGWAKHNSPRRRASACNFFAVFCEVSDLDYSIYRPDWMRQLTTLLDDSQVIVHTTALAAMDTFVKAIPKPELQSLVVPLRRTIESTRSSGHTVPGFSLPKGVAPMVPIIIAGLTTGNNEQQEQAAYAIGDLVERTEESAIKPFVVPFTGPLIRVATQSAAYPPAVKTAILSALISMLDNIPAFVKPFFPQLQRTFIKSASDPSSSVVRTKAAQALGALMKHQPRVDPVITELITGANSNEGGIATSLVLALSKVVHSASDNVGEKAREACLEVVSDAFREPWDESYVQAIAALFKSLSPYPNLLHPIVMTYLMPGTPQTPISSHAILAVLSSDEDEAPADNLFQKLGVLKDIAQKIIENASNEKPNVARPAREAREILKSSSDDSLAGIF